MSEGYLADYLDHMRQAATEACSFVDGLSKDEFLADKRTRQAVILSLMIIGEAAAKIMERHSAFAARRQEIPWRSMRGMRNRIAHGYFDIDLDIVWDTVHDALPNLLASLASLDVSDKGW